MDQTAGPLPNLAELARKLAAAVPGLLGGARRDVESQLQAVLQAQLSKLDICSRQDFDVQAKVLERTRERLQRVEERVAALEARAEEIETGRAAR